MLQHNPKIKVEVVGNTDVCAALLEKYAEVTLLQQDNFVISQFKNISLCVKFCSSEEIKQLKAKYLEIDEVTDVLAFPSDSKDADDCYLGDIALCTEFINIEAKKLHLECKRHFQHIFVHGLLHLLGYDHVDSKQKLDMQKREREILAVIEDEID